MKKPAAQIIEASTCSPRVTATVELMSKVFRPFLWRVTVIGQPPHARVRVYDIASPTDDIAARAAIKLFIDETKRPFLILPGP